MWEWAIWTALIVASLAGVGPLLLLAVRARRAWLTARDTHTDVLHRLDDFARKAEAAAEKIAAIGDTAELQASVERLRISLTQLAVLRAALDEVGGTVGRVTAYLPRK
jgi:hypothetical protein